jgi:hypothetical protein
MLVQVSPPNVRPHPPAQKASRVLPRGSLRQTVPPAHEVVQSPRPDVQERQKSARYAR